MSATKSGMALPQEPIEKFAGHIDAMRSFVNYILTMMQTFPIVMTKLDERQRREVYEPCLKLWAEFVSNLYKRPDLYANPPNPLPVDPTCSGWAMSDHIKERLGRNYPLFDFANAPFTHPLGTQISLICINYSWDAYDTFIKEMLGLLKTRCSSDSRIRTLIESEQVTKLDGKNFAARLKSILRLLWPATFSKGRRGSSVIPGTNEKLRILGILPKDEEVAAAVRRSYELQSDLKPEQVPLTLQVAKELRTCFTHRFGQPSEKLVAIIKSSRFEDFPIRLTDDGYEVTLVLSRMIAEVIQVMAYQINQKAVQNYGTLFRERD